MTEREKILGRVREALKTPAAMPGSHESRSVVPPAKLNAAGTAALPLARQWLPKVGESFDERLALFQANAAGLKADFQVFASRDELKTAISKMSTAENWKHIASHQGELTDLISAAPGLPICFRSEERRVGKK